MNLENVKKIKKISLIASIAALLMLYYAENSTPNRPVAIETVQPYSENKKEQPAEKNVFKYPAAFINETEKSKWK